MFGKKDEYDDPAEIYKDLGVIESTPPEDTAEITQEAPVEDDSLFENIEPDEVEQTGEILPENHPLKKEGSVLPSLAMHLKHEYNNEDEKHAILQLIIAEMFKNYGYKTKVGAEFTVREEPYAVDVYAEYDCGLHVSKLMIKAENELTSETLKQLIMKEYDALHELGFDRLIVATTSIIGDFNTSKYSNVNVWDLSQLQKLDKDKPEVIDSEDSMSFTVVKPGAKKAEIEKHAEKTAKKHSGGMFNKNSKIAVDSIDLVYYPYFACELTIEMKQKKKAGMFKSVMTTVDKKVIICLDGLNGQPIVYGKQGVSYKFGYYTSLNEKKREILRLGAKHKKVTVKEMKPHEIIKNQDTADLMQQGLIDYVSDSPFVYKNLASYPSSLASFAPISTKRTLSTAENQIEPTMTTDRLQKTLESWNDKGGGSISRILYPIYIVTYKSDDQVHKEVYDGTSGIAINKFPELP